MNTKSTTVSQYDIKELLYLFFISAKIQNYTKEEDFSFPLWNVTVDKYFFLSEKDIVFLMHCNMVKE